jgi:hypothetical protein
MRRLWGKVKEMEWREMEVRKRWKSKKRERMTSRRNEIKRTGPHTDRPDSATKKKKPFNFVTYTHTLTVANTIFIFTYRPYHDLCTRQ